MSGDSLQDQLKALGGKLGVAEHTIDDLEREVKRQRERIEELEALLREAAWLGCSDPRDNLRQRDSLRQRIDAALKGAAK